MTDLDILTPDDLAKTLGVPRSTVLRRLSKQPGFPASVNGTRKPRWLASEVRKFLRSKSVHSSHKALKAA